MYCPKCGAQNAEKNVFCQECGAKLAAEAEQKVNKTGSLAAKMKPAAQISAHTIERRQVIFYVTLVIAALECILPFMKWIKIPMMQSLFGLFGEQDLPSYSLYGYIGTINDMGNNKVAAIVVLILSLFAIMATIFNIVFLVKGLKRKKGYYKYGRTASVLMLIVSLVFLIILGLLSLILQVIKITIAPWILLVGSVANLVLIGKVKKAESAEA